MSVHHEEAPNCRASSMFPRLPHATCPTCAPEKPQEASHVITTTFRREGVDYVRIEHYTRAGQMLTEPWIVETKNKDLARAHWSEVHQKVLVNPSIPATWAERHDVLSLSQNEEVTKQ